jgi:hypothetical protein
MRLKLATAAVIGVLVAAIAVPASTASADVSQTPVTTGCASGYQRPQGRLPRESRTVSSAAPDRHQP